MKHCILTQALWRTVCALLLLFVFASCEHKELCIDHFHNTPIQVVFDWKNAPDAAPESMRLYLYPEDGSKPLVYEFADYLGGRVNIPAGKYRAICVNSDTESILYRNTDSYDTFEAYAATGSLETRSGSLSRTAGTEEERVVLSCDPLYTGCLEGVTVPFALTSDGESTLTTDFLAFDGTKKESGDGTGGEETVPETHKMTVYAVMTDGTKNSQVFEFFLEDLGDSEDRDSVSSIKVDSLPLPKPIVNGGGFHPVVDGWTNINVDISM